LYLRRTSVAVTGRIKTSHLTILPQLIVLSQTSPYQQFALVTLRHNSQLPAFRWVDFAQSWLVRTAPLHRYTSVVPL